MTNLADCLKAGAAGIDIPNEEYHKLDGVSGSKLNYLAESNKHLDNCQLFQSPHSPALIFGNVFHTCCLEPKEFDNRYAVLPTKFETKAITGISIADSIANFHEDNNDKIVIEHKDYIRAQKMAKNAAVILGDILTNGIKERSHFVDLDGVICKCRLDIEYQGHDYDLKSISLGVKSFSNETLLSHIKKYHYDWSCALRNIVRRELGHDVKDSFLVFVDTGSGHMVRIIKLSQDWLAESEVFVLELLEKRRNYLEFGVDSTITEIGQNLPLRYNN